MTNNLLMLYQWRDNVKKKLSYLCMLIWSQVFIQCVSIKLNIKIISATIESKKKLLRGVYIGLGHASDDDKKYPSKIILNSISRSLSFFAY